MRPVTQTSFYDPDAPPDKQRGNCLTAVVASLLELPIEAVPNFVQDHVDHAASEDDDAGDWNWWTRLHRFVGEHGHRMHYLRNVEATEPYPSHPDGFPDPEPGEYYTVSGRSPRDHRIHHIVIYRDGEMAWDPHPDRTGIVSVEDQYHWTLRPEEAAPECRVLGCTMPPLDDGKCVRCGDGPGRGPDQCPCDCGRRKRRDHLMCKPCWADVSTATQGEVLSTWRRWRRQLGDHEALQAYKTACRTAVREVTGR